MRQNTKQNYIAYALLTGLLVCGFLFFATPVMAQEITNAELKESIDTLKNKESGFSTAEILITIIGVIGVAIIAGVGFLIRRVWEFPKLTERVDNLIKEVKELKKDFKKHAHSAQNELIVESNSPLQLTERGREHFENSGCRAYFEKHLQEWLKDFEGLDKDYRIHEKAREVIEEKYKQNTDPNIEDIKAYMFNEGVPHDKTMLMMSIGLRDMICEKKGITIKRVKQPI